MTPAQQRAVALLCLVGLLLVIAEALWAARPWAQRPDLSPERWQLAEPEPGP